MGRVKRKAEAVSSFAPLGFTANCFHFASRKFAFQNPERKTRYIIDLEGFSLVSGGSFEQKSEHLRNKFRLKSSSHFKNWHRP